MIKKIIMPHKGLLVILAFGIFPLFPLLHSGLPVTHDGQDHVARIANFYQNLSEGNIIPRWAGNLNWGYGHPILMFLYPFPSYFASFFHFLGFSLIDSVKIVFAVSYVLSGIGMYIWIKNMWGEKAGILSSIVYLYAPYRFVDLYVRGAIGEHVAFMFAPFICYFIFRLSKKYSYTYFVGFSLSVTGLLLSHNAIAIMLLPIIILYSLTLSQFKNVNFFITLAVGFLIGFGLSAFFIIPAFFEGKYTLRDTVTGNFEYRDSFVPIVKFFDISWNFGGTQFLSKQIGIPIVVAFFATLYFTLKNKRKNVYIFTVFGGSILASIFLMTYYSDFIWKNISLIQKFQFPWRFLSVVVFSGSVLAGLSTTLFEKRINKNIFFILIIFFSIFISSFYIKSNGYLNKPESFFSDVYFSTTDTGESAPVWSVRFMEKEAILPVEVIEGEASVKDYRRSSTSRIYTINAETAARVRENTLYFPNWEVFINDNKTTIQYHDSFNRGLITYNVPKGESKIKVIFNDTKQRVFANSISIISLCILFIISFIPKRYLAYDS